MHEMKIKEKAMATITVTDQSFAADVEGSETPVLVDFWAEWCGPCKQIAPILEELAGEYEGKITIAKVDIDNNQSTASTLGIRSIPTLIMYKDGTAVDSLSGAHPAATIRRMIDSSLEA